MAEKLNWDDLRVFLAVAQEGSINGAAASLTSSRSTVWRRMRALSESLGVTLIETRGDGTVLTEAGQEVLDAVAVMESSTRTIERRIMGREQKLEGILTVTLPEIMMTDLLTPAIARFCDAHPEIDLMISSSHRPLDLERRQADVAIRVSEAPPDDLVGRRVIRGAVAPYASRAYLERHDITAPDTDAKWLGWQRIIEAPKWVAGSVAPHASVRHAVTTSFEHLAMIRAGMGMAYLPCFYGDTQPDLLRLPGSEAALAFDIWVLFHPELRNTARVRAFSEFMGEAISEQRALIEGNTSMSHN